MGYEQSALDKESLQEEIKQARLYLSELEEKLQKLGNNK
jgi:hypothetical protein